MPLRERARWALAAVLSMAMLSAPAVWNRFPLLQYDTGGYLARWYEGYLVPSRAVVYGLILGSGSPLSFWPVVLGQSALTVWVIALVLRTHGMGGRPRVARRSYRRLIGDLYPALADRRSADRYFRRAWGVRSLSPASKNRPAQPQRTLWPFRTDCAFRRHSQRDLRGAIRRLPPSNQRTFP